ncbi:MAG: bifunctional DNA-formamidopyrimidine glycosylase/DNA-(apurinic or apyrimidinic site) lyase [Planctomycetota bacterium]
MPELPEVETVVRQVAPGVVGRRVESLDVRWARTLEGGTRARVDRALVGRRIERARRRAKWIVLDLEGGDALLVHLRMTGRLFVRGPKDEPSEYLRLSLGLSGRKRLDFEDVRKFGRVRWTRDAEAEFADLGPEPLDDAFTEESLHERLVSRSRMLKPLLLDQTVVAGLGNIYVDETLFESGLHPLRDSRTLGRDDTSRIHASMRRILARAILQEGSSFDVFYRTPEGKPGRFQDEFRVYGREGKSCVRCGGEVVKIVVAQRGTHLCPVCQPRPRARRRARATS